MLSESSTSKTIRSATALDASLSRRFAWLKSEGLTANNAGDARQALRRLYDADLIYPSCANVLSVANMHLKVGHPTLAAPLYYHVLHASEATKKEQLIFQWHFIPETRQNYKGQKTRDEVSKCYY